MICIFKKFFKKEEMGLPHANSMVMRERVLNTLHQIEMSRRMVNIPCGRSVDCPELLIKDGVMADRGAIWALRHADPRDIEIRVRLVSRDVFELIIFYRGRSYGLEVPVRFFDVPESDVFYEIYQKACALSIRDSRNNPIF